MTQLTLNQPLTHSLTHPHTHSLPDSPEWHHPLTHLWLTWVTSPPDWPLTHSYSPEWHHPVNHPHTHSLTHLSDITPWLTSDSPEWHHLLTHLWLTLTHLSDITPWLPSDSPEWHHPLTHLWLIWVKSLLTQLSDITSSLTSESLWLMSPEWHHPLTHMSDITSDSPEWHHSLHCRVSLPLKLISSPLRGHRFYLHTGQLGMSWARALAQTLSVGIHSCYN